MGSGGSIKGPKYPRVADRLVKRMIRGMLPRDRMKGQDAYRRLRCYIGAEKEEGAARNSVPSKQGTAVPDSSGKVIKLNHKKPMKYSTIKEIVRLLK